MLMFVQMSSLHERLIAGSRRRGFAVCSIVRIVDSYSKNAPPRPLASHLSRTHLEARTAGTDARTTVGRRRRRGPTGLGGTHPPSERDDKRR